MQIAQRFTLLVKGRLNAVLDSMEDPERSLNQLLLDMVEELEEAKQAVAGAMANEDRLLAQIRFFDKDAKEWQKAAQRAWDKGNEADARQALKRVELAERQHQKLTQELEEQSRETQEVRETVVRMQQRLGQARSRLQIVQAQMRQAQARRAAGKILRSVERTNLYAEFERISDRAQHQTATERAYQRLDDELSGDAVRRRFEEAAVSDAVEERLSRLKAGGQEDSQADSRRMPEDPEEPAR